MPRLRWVTVSHRTLGDLPARAGGLLTGLYDPLASVWRPPASKC